jgi:hypothetical protein
MGGVKVQTRALQPTGPEFDRLFVQSLDDSFTKILGEIPMKTFYDGLEKKHAITRNRIPERLDEFTAALEIVFGVTCSKVLMRIIATELYSKLGLTFIERPDWRLHEYVTEAKSRTTLFKHRKLTLTNHSR